MKFLEQINIENSHFVSYLKGSLFFIFFHFLGQIPLTQYLISQPALGSDYSNQI